jgi:4-oxalocrotonate tautomerase
MRPLPPPKETVMPHVLVKLYSGRTEQQKSRLAEAVTKAVTTTLNCGDEAVSVSIEDINPRDWTAKVYKPDIQNNPHIYKKPGYDPSE